MARAIFEDKWLKATSGLQPFDMDAYLSLKSALKAEPSRVVMVTL